MLTTRPHLTSLRPSPTTASFTVSTASRNKTLPSQVLRHLLFTLRILLGLATTIVLLAKSWGGFHYLPTFLSDYIETAPWSHIGPLSFASLFFVFRRFHTGISFLEFATYCELCTICLPNADMRFYRRISPDPSLSRHPDQYPIELLPPAK